MAADRLFLLLDQGGHSSRALVMDQGGRLRARATRAVASREPGRGRVEQDGEAIVTDLRAAVREAAGQLGPDVKHMEQAGLAVQRGSVLCWDRHSGEALTPVLSWRDRRRPAHQVGPEAAELVRRETGLRLSPYGGAAKLRWCLEAVPAVQRARDEGRLAFGPLGSFLIHHLLAEAPHRLDPGLAQRTLLFSLRQGDWSEALLARFGLPRAPLPAVVDSHHGWGTLRDLPGPVPLTLVLGDQNVVPDLAGERSASTAFINLGTGAFLLRPLAGPVTAAMEASPFQLSLLPPPLGGDGVDGIALEGSVHGAGSALDWLARQTGRLIPFERLDGILAAETDPPLFLNTVDGLGSPWWQPGPAPAFRPEETTADAQLAGVLESVMFLLRINLAAMDALAGDAERVVVAGGLSRSDGFCRRLAALLGREVARLEGGEATATGLWRRLAGVRGGAGGLEVFAPGDGEAVTARYHRWLEVMPDL